jgi:hypothetical protein
MPVWQSDQDAAGEAPQNGEEAVHYPTNHVVAILDTQDQTACAVDALVHGGFLDSEVELIRGNEEADRLAGGTGRRGFQDWFIRLTGSVGLKNAETEMKDRYEQALRDGNTVLAILTPTEDRKDRAAEIIKECGGRFINFFGRLSVERITR